MWIISDVWGGDERTMEFRMCAYIMLLATHSLLEPDTYVCKSKPTLN